MHCSMCLLQSTISGVPRQDTGQGIGTHPGHIVFPGNGIKGLVSALPAALQTFLQALCHPCLAAWTQWAQVWRDPSCSSHLYTERPHRCGVILCMHAGAVTCTLRECCWRCKRSSTSCRCTASTMYSCRVNFVGDETGHWAHLSESLYGMRSRGGPSLRSRLGGTLDLHKELRMSLAVNGLRIHIHWSIEL